MRRRRRGWRVAAATVVGLAILLVAAGAWLAQADAGQIPPDVSIGGVPVGGLPVGEARSRIGQAAAEATSKDILLVYPDGRLTTSGAALGARPDIEAAIEQAVTSRGVLGRVSARIGIGGTIEVPLEYEIASAALLTFTGRIARIVDVKPRSASVRVRDRQIEVTPGEAGRSLDRDALAAALSSLSPRITLRFTRPRPAIDLESAYAAQATAESLLVGMPAASYRDRRFVLPQPIVLRALRFDPKPKRGIVAVALDPVVLEAPLRRVFHRFERAPREASFRIEGNRVIVARSGRGRTIDTAASAEELVRRAGLPTARVRFHEVRPTLTTEEARSYRIRKPVSEFTTPYPCCQPRVTNIQRGTALLNGMVIPPGGTFSLNRALGKRTRERGFVKAPMILAGRLVDAVGGGVSQIATTVYNAAFFAGLDLVAHTPHQFYISRYPMGREATVSWGGPELVVRNDWPAGILVQAVAGETSITIRFWSSRLGRRIETQTGQPYDPRPATTIRVLNPDLPAGSEETVQAGGLEGFTVQYTRRVYRGTRLIRDEHFTTRYDPEDTVVEYGPATQAAAAN